MAEGDKGFEVPEHLVWTPPAADPDDKYRREAQRQRIEATNDAFILGAPLRITPTWQQLRAAEAAKVKAAADVEAGKKVAADATSTAADLEKQIAATAKLIADAERKATGDAVREEAARIQRDRQARGKKKLDEAEARSRAARNLRGAKP